MGSFTEVPSRVALRLPLRVPASGQEIADSLDPDPHVVLLNAVMSLATSGHQWVALHTTVMCNFLG